MVAYHGAGVTDIWQRLTDILTVLLVDDEAPFREAVARRLVKRGFNVDQAGGGEEALQRLDHALPHVVVLDVKMPDMDGLTHA